MSKNNDLSTFFPEIVLTDRPRIYLASKKNGEYVIQFNDEMKSYEVAHRNLDSDNYIISYFSWSGVLRIFLTVMDETFQEQFAKYMDANL